MSGVKPRDTLAETEKSGKFVRTASVFREVISDGHPTYKPEPDRYHLYISYACPWANRCLAVRNLKGLQNVIGLSVVHPTWQKTRPDDPEDPHHGWTFANPDDPPFSSPTGHGQFPCTACIPDTVNGARTIRELYEKSNDTNGKYSVPVLWDKKTGTIVNNESAEIVRMFNSAFNNLATNPDLDLYPEHLRERIDEINSWVYDDINNGVYKSGFATTQAAYEEAVEKVFHALDRVEEILSTQRYIAGNQLTEADIRLFMTLVRFDEVYVVYFKCNKKSIIDYPNMRQYCREMLQLPGVTDSINMYHIKTHYYTSHTKLNTYAIVPVGPDAMADMLLPHDRDRF